MRSLEDEVDDGQQVGTDGRVLAADMSEEAGKVVSRHWRGFAGVGWRLGAVSGSLGNEVDDGQEGAHRYDQR